MGRTVVIGLDGVDWSALGEFVEDGTCPRIAEVMRRGVHGDLESIDPPISVPAWLCFASGKEPQDLELYNFTRREPGTYDMHRVHNEPRYQRDAFWTGLDDIGVVNVPSIYPEGAYDGFLVGGPLGPGGTYPAELQADLDERGFVRDLPKGWQFRESLDVLDRNGDIVAELFEREAPDFFMAVTSVPDRVQHAYWGEEEKMRELYAALDDYVGKILDHVDPDEDTVFLVSDHGFAGIEKTFYLNSWLRDEGFLAVKDGEGDSGEDVRFRVKKLAKTVLERLGLLEFALRWVPDRVRRGVERPDEIWDRIDWEKTTAFASGQYVGQLYLNTEADYPAGLVAADEYGAVRDELVQRLTGLEDPETGEAVVEEVWTREELYGDDAAFAPDITFYTTDMTYKVKEELHGSVFDDSIPRGAHGKTGILVAAGPDIVEGTVDAALVDLAPTLLHLMDAPVPADMAGEVAVELFREGSEPAERPVRRSDEAAGIDI